MRLHTHHSLGYDYGLDIQISYFGGIAGREPEPDRYVAAAFAATRAALHASHEHGYMHAAAPASRSQQVREESSRRRRGGGGLRIWFVATSVHQW